MYDREQTPVFKLPHPTLHAYGEPHLSSPIKIPRRTFLHNGFDDILCGIHPRELLQIEI